MKTFLTSLVLLIGIVLTAAVLRPVSAAQLARTDVPPEEEGIGVDPRMGEMLDGGLLFHDSENRAVELGSLFDGKRPVILSFNYSNCPKLCSVLLQNLTQALREVEFSAGKDYRVVSVSIDPNEQTPRARATRQKYLDMYNRPGSEEGWTFLLGDDRTVHELAAQAGVRYKYLPEQKLFSHPPVLILVSPDGKLVRYLFGMDVRADTLQGALVEAAAGKIGSPVYFLTYLTGCYVYNDTTGRYTMPAMFLMRAAGVVTIIGLALGTIPWLWPRRNSRVSGPGNGSDAPASGQLKPGAG